MTETDIMIHNQIMMMYMSDEQREAVEAMQNNIDGGDSD